MKSFFQIYMEKYHIHNWLIFLGLSGFINIKYFSMTTLLILAILGIFVLISFRKDLLLNREDKVFIILMVLLPMAFFLNMLFFGFVPHHLDRPFRMFLGVFAFLLLETYGVSKRLVFIALIICLVYASCLSYYKIVILNEPRAYSFIYFIPFGNFALLLGLIGLSYIYLNNKLSKWNKIALGFIIFSLSLWVSIASGTRGGWVVLPILIFILTFIFDFIKNIHRVIIILLLSVIFIMSYFTSDFIKNKINIAIEEMNLYLNTEQQSDMLLGSFGTRLEMWRYGLKLFAESPVFGQGFVGFDKRLKEDVENKKVNRALLDHGHLHNDIINIMAKQGLVGLAVYLVFYMMLFQYFFKRMKNRNLTEDVRFFATVGGLTVAGMFLFSLSDSMFGTAAGITNYVFLITLAAGGMRYYEKLLKKEVIYG
ncbi:O-antigen ligase family protein [Calditerrivibrio nitroreducens]|uniref:O-antigen polymerase n=1 Tax=Calditerrivibrio nitroreducens (strain DSM 19672 / NBRC 101217 / Yu37-1) TaxID=768670 RepID=E4TI72_CALNY|nr:O-antigen ligase family protein [Calditerrivibrio nitroreducens]ADR18988.1 O-antigen polymerase [Calditerrivibrio nitroreducens DSM 19672]